MAYCTSFVCRRSRCRCFMSRFESASPSCISHQAISPHQTITGRGTPIPLPSPRARPSAPPRLQPQFVPSPAHLNPGPTWAGPVPLRPHLPCPAPDSHRSSANPIPSPGCVPRPPPPPPSLPGPTTPAPSVFHCRGHFHDLTTSTRTRTRKRTALPAHRTRNRSCLLTFS